MNIQTEVLQTERATRNRLSRAEYVLIAEQMKKYIIKHPDGRVSYVKGWSDKRVAREALPKRTSVISVVNLRKQLFGTLADYDTHGDKTNRGRLAKLELRVSQLEELLMKVLSK